METIIIIKKIVENFNLSVVVIYLLYEFIKNNKRKKKCAHRTYYHRTLWKVGQINFLFRPVVDHIAVYEIPSRCLFTFHFFTFHS